jgi:hypothetical protein
MLSLYVALNCFAHKKLNRFEKCAGLRSKRISGRTTVIHLGQLYMKINLFNIIGDVNQY